MPLYEIEIPGQGKYQVESPTELTDVQAYAAAAAQANAPQQAAPEAKTSNPFKGLAARGASILGEGIEGVARVAEKYGDKLETAIPLSNLSPDEIKNNRQLEPLFGWADSLKNWGKDIGYEPSTKLNELSSNPLKAVPFIAERVISSSPDMAAAVVAMPAYVASRTNEILNDRIKNDEKTLDDVTVSDVASAAGAAILEASLEKFATKGLLKGKGVTGKTAGTRIAKEVGIQSGTEAVEEGVGYLGGTAGTKKGVDTNELAQSMLEGAIVGTGLGGGVQAGKEYVNRPKAKVEAPAEETKGPSGVVVDENGQVVDKEVLAKREAAAKAAEPIQEETAAAAPLTGQGELFTQEEAPYQVTPSERTAQTESGQTVTEPIADAEVQAKQEASDKAQAQIAELQQKLSQTTNRDEALAIRDQISKLELDVQQGPGATLDTFKQEYDALEQKKLALAQISQQLTEQRDATPKLDDKLPITQQINAIEEQAVQIDARQKELLAEGKKITVTCSIRFVLVSLILLNLMRPIGTISLNVHWALQELKKSKRPVAKLRLMQQQLEHKTQVLLKTIGLISYFKPSTA